MTNENETAYPLAWPTGWPRTKPGARRRALFRDGRAQISIYAALGRLRAELTRFDARRPVCSTNVETRADGMPRSDRRAPDDPGVAVYFTLKDERIVLACDKWDRVPDNIAAIAAHIDAVRAQARYGVGTLEQAFSGYAKLPAPDHITWRTVLGLAPNATLDEAESAFKRLSMLHHPDRGGSHAQMAELNAAIANARKQLKP